MRIKGKVELVCEICNKIYFRFYSQRTSRFCSNECHTKYQRVHPELSKGRDKQDLEERFKRNIEVNEENGCWEWKLGRDKDKYGKIKVDGKHERAHRISWRMFKGEIPKGLLVLHKCDNPPCCNPDHLFVGTHKDNSKDCMDKERHCHGENNGAHKLSNEDVWMLRRWWSTGLYKIQELADIMKVSKPTIDRVINYRYWKYI